jgi:hypothetical protein
MLAAARFRFQFRADKIAHPGTKYAHGCFHRAAGGIFVEEAMHSTRHGFLAAAAAVALIAGTGGAFAQVEKKMDTQTGVEAQGESQGSAKKSQSSGAGGQSSGAGGTVQGGAESGTNAGMKEDRMQSGQDGKRSGQAQQPSQDSEGQTSAQDSQSGGKPVTLDSQQRTKISQTIKQKNVNLRQISRSDINFQINVGAVVPRTFTLYPLPAPVIAVVPAFRGYLYIVVGDDLLIIHPRTYEIVAVIPA